MIEYWTNFINHLDNPIYLWSIPVAIAIMFALIRTNFVKLHEDIAVTRMRKKSQWIMIFSRILVLTLLFTALASPFVEREKQIEGDPFIKILTDSSTSMQVFDQNIASELEAKLEQYIQVETRSIATGQSSNIGDGILNNIREGDNVLLITDGQSTLGSEIGDVSIFAAGHNITFNAIDLQTTTDDAYVIVEGPDKTVANVENTFTIRTGWASKQKKNVQLTVTINGKNVLETDDSETIHTVTKEFTEGYHRIEATITAEDSIKENNVFHKTVKVVKKPSVFLWSQTPGSPAEILLRQVYNIDQGSSLPENLDDYYSVVTNGLPIQSISDEDTLRLSEFVEDGNGLLTIGGKSAYDKGGYKNTFFESLLPVVVGTPGKEPGDVNIVVLIDASGSAGNQEGGGVEIAKALSIDILSQMDDKVKVGIVAFRNIAYDVAPLGYKTEHVGLDNKIQQIYGLGGTNMHLGMQRAMEMLANAQGSKNIIVISDGVMFPNNQLAANDAALLARQQGITTYTVGSGIGDEEFLSERIDEDYLKELAGVGGGIYFRARESSKLELLFGDVEPPNPEEETDWGVSILDGNHFITEDLEVNATIYGFNAVAPKTTGRMLAVTSTGEPLLTTWHLGLGRVAAYSTDDGTSWSGQLLSKDNSKLLIRSMNWINGDPDRKRPDIVDVRDTRVNEKTEITIKADTQPVAEGLAFFRIRPDTYQATVTPTTIGFHDILGGTYAAQYPAELAPLGMSKGLTQLVGNTGGKLFTQDQIEEIVDFTRSNSVKQARVKDYYRWHLAVAAAIILLIEIFLRRLLRR
jgi:hypothetical protein